VKKNAVTRKITALAAFSHRGQTAEENYHSKQCSEKGACLSLMRWFFKSPTLWQIFYLSDGTTIYLAVNFTAWSHSAVPLLLSPTPIYDFPNINIAKALPGCNCNTFFH
jgi:hypothetical protein